MEMRQPEQGFLAGRGCFTDGVAGAGNARAGAEVSSRRAGGVLAPAETIMRREC